MTPWTERFLNLQSHEEIRSRSQHIPPSLSNLEKLEIESACKKLEMAFTSLFIPTEQTVGIMAELLGLAHAHSASTYISNKQFMSGLYAASCPLPEMFFPACLTGLAGVGKTQLLEALRRMVSDRSEVKADLSHSPFPLRSAWHLRVRDRMTVSGILLNLLEEENFDKHDDPADSKISSSSERTNRKNTSHLLNRCRRVVYKSGVSLIIADEFQFATRSENANTLVVSMLHHLAAIGVPMLYAANYSLCQKIKKRPQEDLQRLLTRPMVLLPDLASSKDWLDTLTAYKQIAPEIFSFDPAKDAYLIHGWTAGLKRLLGNLLVIAYRRARGDRSVVTISHIEEAFKSVQYSINRTDVNLIHQQNITGMMARKDLWCPFELPKLDVAARKSEAQGRRLLETATRMVGSGLTKEERETFSDLEKAAKNSTRSTKATVASLKGAKPSLLDALKRGETILRGSTDSRKFQKN